MRNVMGEILKFAENRGKDADILTSRLNQVFTPVAEMFGVPVDPQQPAQGAMPPQQPAQGAMPPQQSAPTAFSGVAAAGPGWTDVVGPDGQVIRREGTRAWRNNNPGNIEYGDFATSRGAIGTDGRFAVFPSYEDGRAAKEALLFESPSYRDRTISSAINRYAPPTENDTRNYVGQVTSALGVSPDTRLSDLSPQQRNTMLDAMQQVEGFRPGTQNGSPVDDTYRTVADALDVNVSTSGNLDTNDRRNVESLLGEMLNDTVFDQEQADADAAQWRRADLWTAFGTGIGQIGRGDAVDFSDIRNRAERRRNQNIELRMERARRAAGAQLALDMGDESMASAIAGGAADTNTLLTKRQQDLVNRRANEQITRQAAQAGYLADALQDSGLPASKIEAIRNGVDPTTILRVAEMSKAAEAAAAAQERIESQMDLVENLREQSMAARDATAAGQDAPQMDPILDRALELAQLDGYGKIRTGGSLYDYMSEARQQAGGQQDQQQVSNNLAAAQAILQNPNVPDAARVAAQLVVDQGGALSPDEAADQITVGGAFAPPPTPPDSTETERAFLNARNIAAQEGRLEEFDAQFPNGVLSFLYARSRGQGTGLTARERYAPAVVDTDNLQASDSRISSDFDPTNVFGIYGVGTNIANTISEVLTGQLADPASRLARLDMDRLATTTLIDNAESVAGRPTNFLMEQFQSLETRPTRVLTGPETARLSLQNQAAAVERGIQENNRILQSGAASEDMLEQAAAGNFRLGALLQDYRSALSAFDKAGIGEVDATPEQDEASFSDFDSLRGALEAGEVEVGQVVVVNGKRYRARLGGQQ